MIVVDLWDGPEAGKLMLPVWGSMSETKGIVVNGHHYRRCTECVVPGCYRYIPPSRFERFVKGVRGLASLLVRR